MAPRRQFLRVARDSIYRSARKWSSMLIARDAASPIESRYRQTFVRLVRWLASVSPPIIFSPRRLVHHLSSPLALVCSISPARRLPRILGSSVPSKVSYFHFPSWPRRYFVSPLVERQHSTPLFELPYRPVDG